MEVVFFDSPADLRGWFEQHHDTATELWIGFYRKASGRSGISYAEALDQALCFGWIDGVRRRVDELSYTNRFTPRKRGSNWSQVNIKRVGELSALELMHPAGLAAFERRDEARSREYSHEQRGRGLGEELEAIFRRNERAWDFFQAQPPGYRRTASWWVVSAKREETRRKRLATLIEDSENGRRLAGLARPAKLE